MKTTYKAFALAILLVLGLFTVPAHNEEQRTNTGTSLNNVKPACGISLSGPEWIVVNDDDDDTDEKWDFDIEPVTGEDETKMITVTGTMPESCEGSATVEVEIKKGQDRIEGFWKGKKTVTDKDGIVISEDGDDVAGREKRSGKSQPYTFNVSPGQTVTVHLWIEGIHHSTGTEPDVLIEAKTSYNHCTIHGELGPEKLEMRVYQADLDVDSDNLNGLEFAGFSDEEDKIENSDKEVDGFPRPGKIVLPTSLKNTDEDDVPDYADGFSLGGLSPLSEPALVTNHLRFIPVRVEIKEPFNPESAEIVFEFPNESKPVISDDGLVRNGEGIAGSPVTVAVKKPGFRLWRVKPESRSSGDSVPDGDWIPQGVKLKWKDILSNSGTPGREARLYLEYLDSNPPVLKGKVTMSATVTEGYGGPEYVDKAKLNRVPADVDTDSDNNNGLNDPDRGDIEEGYQYGSDDKDSIEKPGKILLIHDGDIDCDGIPDYADGLSDKFQADGMRSNEGLDGATGVDFIPQGSKLAPILLDIAGQAAEGGDGVTEKLYIRFEYDASDPDLMEKIDADPEKRVEYRLPGEGSLRLWTRRAEEQETRSVRPARDGGHFIPDGHVIRWNDLKGMLEAGPGGTSKLWIEAVKASEVVRDRKVVVSLGIDTGGNSIQWLYDETLTFTAIGQRMVDIAGDGSTSPAKGYAMSHCSPVIKLTKDKVGEAYLTKYDGWKVDIDIQGQITSDFLDTVTADQGGTIDKVYLYLNNNDTPFATVDVQYTKGSDPGNLAKPFPYLGNFTYQNEAKGAVDGKNVLTVRTQDKVFQMDGIVVATFELDLPDVDYEQLPPPPPEIPEGQDYTCFTTSTVKSTVYEIQLLDGLAANAANNLKFTSVTTLPPVPATIHEMVENGADTRFFAEGPFLIRIESEDFQPDPDEIGFFAAGFYHLEDGVPVLDRTIWFIEDLKDSDKYYAWEDESAFAGYSVPGGGSVPPITINPVVVQPTTVYTSDGGEFHPQAMEMLGPKELIESLSSVKFTDLTVVEVEGASASVGFEADFTVKEEKIYVANTQNGDAAAVVCYRETLEGDQFPLISDQIYQAISTMQTKTLYPKSWGQFAKGFAIGIGKGGVDMVGGVVDAGKAAVKIAPKVILEGAKAYVRAQAWGIKFLFKLVTGQSVEQEIHDVKECVAKVTEKVSRFFNLAEEGIAVAEAILKGDYKRLDNLSGTMRDIVSAGVEVFTGMVNKAYGDDYERGIFWGRATFEMASTFFPLSKIGAVGKLEFLTKLRATKFFSEGLGSSIMNGVDEMIALLPNRRMCFVAGTLVWTANGAVPIEKISPGTLVWSRSDRNPEAVSLKPVLQTFTTHPMALVRLTVDADGDGDSDDTITGTYLHPFWVEDIGEFVPLGELVPGQSLYRSSGVHCSVLTTETFRGPPGGTTYNLEVDDYHTYFVGNLGIWVHNSTDSKSPCDLVFSFAEEKRKEGLGPWRAFQEAVAKLGKDKHSAIFGWAADDSMRELMKLPLEARVSNWPSHKNVVATMKKAQGKAKDVDTGTLVYSHMKVPGWQDRVDLMGVKSVRLESHHGIPKKVQEWLGMTKDVDDCPAYLTTMLEHQGAGVGIHQTLSRRIGALCDPPVSSYPLHLQDLPNCGPDGILQALRETYQEHHLTGFWEVCEAWRIQP